MGRHGDVPRSIRLGVLLLVCLGWPVGQGRADGLIGCKFYRFRCSGDDWCHDDYKIGRCLPSRGFTKADLQRSPLSDRHMRLVVAMLDEMEAADIGWDSRFAQCRIRAVLDALQNEKRAPRNWLDIADPCAHLVSEVTGEDDESRGAPARRHPFTERMAYVRFVPPFSDVYGREPPDMSAMTPSPWQKRQSPIKQKKPHLAQQQQQQQQQPQQHHSEFPPDLVQDIRHRIELRRMLAEYEAGALPEPVYTTYAQQMDRLHGAQQALWQEQQLERQQLEQQQNQQLLPVRGERPQGVLAKFGIVHRQVDNEEDNEPNIVQAEFVEELAEAEADRNRNHVNPFEGQRTSFREVSREYNVPNVVLDTAAMAQLAAAEQTNELPIDEMVLSVTGDEEDQLQRDEQQQQHRRQQEQLGRRMDDEEEEPFDVHRFLEQMEQERWKPKQPEQQAVAAGDIDKFEHHPHNIAASGTVYTEGGLVYVPDPNEQRRLAQKQYAKQQLEAANLLNSMLGFTRHERLDVKKPGPQLVQPDADDYQPPKPKGADAVTAKTNATEDNKSKGDVADSAAKSLKDLFLPKKKNHAMDDHGPHSVDSEYAHVIMRAPIENWSDGPRLVAAIAETLNMMNYLTFSRVDRHEISFRVEENPQRRSASDIARAINEGRTKNNLLRRFGFSVVKAGVGDKTKVPLAVSVVRTKPDSPNVMYIFMYVLFGAGVAAVAVIIAALVYVRRARRSLEKLDGLQAGLTSVESNSKDYQDLCRSRMAGNATASDARIFGGVKETNEKVQTSSRSSVSSWSEEPATNMDISTGHMVLSYMEDHLKNKGRLQREWEALCRYEAEPSSRDAASKPECSALNRQSAPLPYDHSRVLINHLANTDGLDYINASSITDHDPRSAAYIAAQGPLPATLAHFWQMVWEQGSIMIVMLCRLQEMGTISCARYWPEVGSECYDIYEVHLVSEHTTCDDYLVRSFYLKNLRTGETRTVTQFHFLAWPAFGLPAAAKTLLEFRRKVNKSFRGRASPVIVHSSNGAGRTGSYILLDMVLGRMHKGAREIDIAATLEHLRDQRSGLVATQQQFEFVLMAVAEEVHAILKALPANVQPEKRELDSEAVREQDTSETKKLIDVSDADEDDHKDGKPEKRIE